MDESVVTACDEAGAGGPTPLFERRPPSRYLILVSVSLTHGQTHSTFCPHALFRLSVFVLVGMYRQKPPPEAVHLDLPPPHLCGSPSKFRADRHGARELEIERPPTASSKKRPIRHQSAGPMRNSRSQDDTFGARNINRPLSGFGRPTTRQELEQLMGPLSKSELASAQVRMKPPAA